MPCHGLGETNTSEYHKYENRNNSGKYDSLRGPRDVCEVITNRHVIYLLLKKMFCTVGWKYSAVEMDFSTLSTMCVACIFMFIQVALGQVMCWPYFINAFRQQSSHEPV